MLPASSGLAQVCRDLVGFAKKKKKKWQRSLFRSSSSTRWNAGVDLKQNMRHPCVQFVRSSPAVPAHKNSTTLDQNSTRNFPKHIQVSRAYSRVVSAVCCEGLCKPLCKDYIRGGQLTEDWLHALVHCLCGRKRLVGGSSSLFLSPLPLLRPHEMKIFRSCRLQPPASSPLFDLRTVPTCRGSLPLYPRASPNPGCSPISPAAYGFTVGACMGLGGLGWLGLACGCLPLSAPQGPHRS